MNNNFQDKEKIIEYLSVIRDAEVSKPADKADKELIEACVGLLLDLQNKDAGLTPEQINEAVSKIPFVDTEKTINIKTKKKKVNKIKLLLIAAIIPLIITILTLMATADTEWSYFKTLKELFNGVDKTPVGETLYDNDTEFGKITENFYTNPEEFSKDYDINILVPGKGFKKDKLVSISYISYSTGDEIEFRFENENMSYTIYMGDNLQKELNNVPNTQTTINGLDCYIVDLSDMGLYQVYFNHKGYTYRFNHSDSDVIMDLIENLEELK